MNFSQAQKGEKKYTRADTLRGTIGVESEYKQGTKFTMIVNIQVKPGDQFQNKKLIGDSTDQNINISN